MHQYKQMTKINATTFALLKDKRVKEVNYDSIYGYGYYYSTKFEGLLVYRSLRKHLLVILNDDTLEELICV